MLGLSNPELGVLMLALFVVFIMFGFPIAFTLMALGVLFGYFAMGDFVFPLLVQRSYSVMTSDVLVSIPLFVFMGYIIERANILDRLFRSLQLAAGPIPASLALASLATCAIFATATGIVGAVVTLMGLLAFPAMLRAGYDVKIASGVICAGGCLGILIPPSVMLILYGATAGVSVVKLYAGAFFPGIMLAGLYMLYTVVMTLLNPKLAPQLPPEERNVPFTTVIWALITSFLPLFALIAAALGSIVFGLATPSEAAAMGSLGALLLAVSYGADYSRRWALVLIQIYGLLAGAFLIYLIVCGFTAINVDRRIVTVALFATLIVGIVLIPITSFSLRQLKESVFLTARTTAMVCWLFIGSFCFSAVFAYLGGHEPIEKFVLAMNLSSTGIHDSRADHHFRSGLAAGMDRDHRHLHADLPAALEDLRHRSAVLRPVGGAQHSDLVPVAAGGDGAVLFEGGGTGMGQYQRRLSRRDALRADRDRLHDHAVHVPTDRSVVQHHHADDHDQRKA